MVQKFVKELSDSAKQPDRSDSAEHTATEQVEAASREIVHEAFQLPRGFSHRTHYTESTERVQPEQPAPPHQRSAPARQRTENVRTRPDTAPHSTPAPTPQEQGQRAYIQQAAKAAATPPITPESPPERPAPAVPTSENVPRQKLQAPRQRTDDFRTRAETRAPQDIPAPTPQEQGRRAYIQQTIKTATTPPVTPELPQEYPTTPTTPTLENAPRQVSEMPRFHADDIRLRSGPESPQHMPTPAPQEQGRRAYIQQAAKAAATPPITPKSQQERPTPVVPTPENAPRQAPETPRLRTDDIRLRLESETPQHTPTPAPQEFGRRAFVQKTAKDTTKASVRESLLNRLSVSDTPPTEKSPRLRTENVRTRPDAQKPQSTSALKAQEQGRCAFVRQSKKSCAEKTSAQDTDTKPPEIHLSEDIPEREPPRIREKPTITELRDEMPVEPTPEKAPNVRHIKQAGTWTPRNAEPSNRKVELPTHERTVDVPPHDLPPTPQAQAREIFAEKQAQLSRNPSIESIYPPEPAAPVPPQLPVSDAPATTPKRQPVTVGSSKSAPPVQQSAPTQAPSTEQLPAIREKPKPNAAPREKSRRGVSIRTKDTEQISTPKAQSKTSVSKIDVGVKRSFVRAVFR